MRSFWFVLLVFSALGFACSTSQKTAAPAQKVEVKAEEDSLEYQLIVLDPKFDSYLVTQPMAEFYSQEYYENWNKQYVTEWNLRHQNPLRYGGFYETEIDYDPFTDYGLDLNYRLYYYFRFIEKEYGVRLINRGH